MPLVLTRLLCLLLLGLPCWASADDASRFTGATPAQQASLLQDWATHPETQRQPLLDALQDGRLGRDTDKQAFIRDGQTWRATSAEHPAAGPVSPVRLNNRLRNLLNQAQASHGLLADDPQQRLQAARQLQRNTPAHVQDWLQQRLAVEPEAQVRQALTLALANLQLQDSDPQVRLHAIQQLGASGDPSAVARLQGLRASLENDAALTQALERSLAQLERKLLLGEVLGHAFSGLSMGSILLLAALGLAITFGLLGVINMAHGEMLMLGAYCAYLVQIAFQRLAPEWLALYPLAALPVAFLVTACIGMLLERGIIRHLYGRPLETLLATWGISLMLIQAVRVLFGAQNVEVANPAWLSGGIQVLPNLLLPWNRVIMIGFALFVVLLTWLLLNRTRLGLNVRAVTQNRQMAACCGVATGRVDMLAFGLGSGIAGLGGVALSQIGNVGPDLGQGYIIDSFLVVVLGGVGQLAGTVLAAVGLGIGNKLLEPQIGAVLGKILILVLVILFIQKRPQGLFALKGRVID